MADAGITLNDLSLVETHDCFTVAELIEYEAMGLTPEGQGARAIKEGWTQKDGKLPINQSGGLKAKGHPIGATGVSMHALCAMQLAGAAGDIQVPGAKLVLSADGSVVWDDKHGKAGINFQCASADDQNRFAAWLDHEFYMGTSIGAGRSRAAADSQS